jgi:hypothetical protein
MKRFVFLFILFASAAQAQTIFKKKDSLLAQAESQDIKWKQKLIR